MYHEFMVRLLLVLSCLSLWLHELLEERGEERKRERDSENLLLIPYFTKHFLCFLFIISRVDVDLHLLSAFFLFQSQLQLHSIVRLLGYDLLALTHVKYT